MKTWNRRCATLSLRGARKCRQVDDILRLLPHTSRRSRQESHPTNANPRESRRNARSGLSTRDIVGLTAGTDK